MCLGLQTRHSPEWREGSETRKVDIQAFFKSPLCRLLHIAFGVALQPVHTGASDNGAHGWGHRRPGWARGDIPGDTGQDWPVVGKPVERKAGSAQTEDPGPSASPPGSRKLHLPEADGEVVLSTQTRLAISLPGGTPAPSTCWVNSHALTPQASGHIHGWNLTFSLKRKEQKLL